MANAVNRLWKARQTQNFEEIGALLEKDIKISLPAQNMNPSRERFITLLHLIHGGDAKTQTQQIIVGNGMDIASKTKVERQGQIYLCIGIYHLQEGIIRSIEETWINQSQARPHPEWLTGQTETQ